MMVEYATLSSKGQLVIPKRIRDQAGWQPGDQLELIWTGENIELRKRIDYTAERPQTSVVRELLGKYQAALNEERDQSGHVKELRKSLYGKVDS